MRFRFDPLIFKQTLNNASIIHSENLKKGGTNRDSLGSTFAPKMELVYR